MFDFNTNAGERLDIHETIARENGRKIGIRFGPDITVNTNTFCLATGPQHERLRDTSVLFRDQAAALDLNPRIVQAVRWPMTDRGRWLAIEVQSEGDEGFGEPTDFHGHLGFLKVIPEPLNTEKREGQWLPTHLVDLLAVCYQFRPTFQTSGSTINSENKPETVALTELASR